MCSEELALEWKGKQRKLLFCSISSGSEASPALGSGNHGLWLRWQTGLPQHQGVQPRKGNSHTHSQETRRGNFHLDFYHSSSSVTLSSTQSQGWNCQSECWLSGPNISNSTFCQALDITLQCGSCKQDALGALNHSEAELCRWYKSVQGLGVGVGWRPEQRWAVTPEGWGPHGHS